MGRHRGPEETFILSALLSLAGALGWVAFHPGLLAGHYARYPLLALTHLFTLGWVSLMILGVLLRVAPMFVGSQPRGRGLAFTVWGLWVVGAAGLISHMGRGEWFGVWTAGLCLFVAAILLIVLHPGILRRARAGDPVARYAFLAVGNLILASTVGVVIGINRHLGLLPVPPGALLGVHFHLAEGGWVTFMILGFGRKLLPPLAPPAARDPRATHRRLLELELGLLLVILGLLLGRALLIAGSLLLGAAILEHVAPPIRRLCRGVVEDRASFWAAVALVFLAADTLLGVLLGSGLDTLLPWPRDRLLYAYGAAALLGWNTLAITSFGLKLFPLWVWRERFEADWGKRPVPSVKDLYLRPLAECTGIGVSVGCILAVAGILGDSPAWIAGGVWILALGVLAFLVNFVRMSRWTLLSLEFRPGPRDLERFRALREARHAEAGPSDAPGSDPHRRSPS